MTPERFEQLKESLKEKFPNASTENVTDHPFTQEELWRMYTAAKDMNTVMRKYEK